MPLWALIMSTFKMRQGLTPREVQILELVAALGLSNKEIGHRLGIAEPTVRDHMHRIYRTLKVTPCNGNPRVLLVR